VATEAERKRWLLKYSFGDRSALDREFRNMATGQTDMPVEVAFNIMCMNREEAERQVRREREMRELMEQLRDQRQLEWERKNLEHRIAQSVEPPLLVRVLLGVLAIPLFFLPEILLGVLSSRRK
jgi:hypothetical protein